MDTQTAQKIEGESVVTLAPNAISKIKSLLANEPEAAGKFLRISLETGGCSGYQYGFTLDEKKEGDHIISADTTSVLIDPQTAQHLKGSVIDYQQDFSGEGFVIQNPNVKKSCGCGHSVEF